MRCLSCNKRLKSHEATRKAVNQGEYIDLCDSCFSPIADLVAHTEGTGEAFQDETEEDELDANTDSILGNV